MLNYDLKLEKNYLENEANMWKGWDYGKPVKFAFSMITVGKAEHDDRK